MCPFVCAIFLLCLSSLSTAAKFTQVYKWSEMDFEWPSEATRTQAMENGTYNPKKIYPRYMAVYGTRIFLSLEKLAGIPATLVSLPTSSASYAPPKLTPFPSWDLHLHGKGDCEKIQEARGLEVDSVGRLWVLDSGSDKCNSKLWTIDLNNKDQTKLMHRFSLRGLMHDLVLDESTNGTFAYSTRGGAWSEYKFNIFSKDKNESWTVETQEVEIFSIAMSPKKEQSGKLYVSSLNWKELFSISIAALRNGTRAENPKPIGHWTEKPYRMLMDNRGTMYAAFRWQNHTTSWNSSQIFQEQTFYEVVELDSEWPFTFALDENGIFWMTACDEEKKPICRLFKAAVGAKSYLYWDPAEESILSTRLHNILIVSVIFIILISLVFIAFWILQTKKWNDDLSENINDTHHMKILKSCPN
ncbi:Hypothetical predicted protein [Cloeon dipterum]|uniref:Bee-milk protein n=1 Tax=Cloeon dipterum TaxID=197152 RepID=A0A8S1DNI1_9INSE|nr:Hypothetical predicted protein [Cloeon dipterum]